MNTVWIKPIKKTIYCDEYWAKLRVKKDSNGVQYLDVLVGKKNQVHAHIGYNLDNSIKFNEHRKQLHSIEKQIYVEDRLQSKQNQNIDTSEGYTVNLILKLRIPTVSGEVTVREFRFEKHER